MSHQTDIKTGRRRSDRSGRISILLAGVAFLLSLTVLSRAQEFGMLRGEIDASDATTSLVDPTYQPVSQGALPSDDSTNTNGASATRPASAGAQPSELSLPPLPSLFTNTGTTMPATKKSTGKTNQTRNTATERKLDNLRTQSIDPAGTSFQRAQPENQREKAAGGRMIKPDTSPYAPLGIRIGSFLLKPSLEQGIRATTNANDSASGRAAVLSETTLRFDAVSDWARHQATLDASGVFDKTLSGQNVSAPQTAITGSLRLDLADQTTVTTTAGYTLQRQAADTPTAVSGTISQPIVQTLDASLGAERDVGRFFAKVTGNFERQIYGRANLSSGGTLSQSDRNTNYFTAKIRGGLNPSGAIKPFIEVELGRLLYDEPYDTSGYQRSGNRYGLSGGMNFNFGDKLNGEVSAGYLAETFKDPRLRTLESPSIAGNINWSPQRGTNVALSASTTLESSTTPGESGTVLYASNLAITHSLRANLDVTTTLGAWLRDLKVAGSYDYGMSAEVGAVYWFNRFVGVDTSARYEVAESADPGLRYKAASVFVGLKLRH